MNQSRWHDKFAAARSQPATGIAFHRVGGAPLEPIPPQRSRVHAPTGHRVPTCRSGSVGANPPTTFPIPCPNGASRPDVSERLRWSQFRHHVPDPMPQRGIAYQPRVQTLGISPEKETRVLKERRIAACLGYRPRPPYAVFLQNTPILSDGVPRALPWAGMHCPLQGKLRFPERCSELVCVAPLGKWNNGISIPRPCPNGHRVPTCRSGSVGANPPTTFPIPCPTGHRIPAQGANPGNPPGKETRVLKERRIAAGLGTTFWHGTGCEEAVSYSPTRTSALPGQVWKPGPPYPATAAALPPAPWFRIRIFCSRGLLTPVAAPNASPNICLAWGRMRITGFVLADEDVSAPGPNVETGAGVPGYSGGLAASP